MELIDQKLVIKKQLNKEIMAFAILLLFTLIMCSGLICLCWLFSDQPSAILATVILSIIVLFVSYISIIELSYKILMKSYVTKNEYKKQIALAKKYMDIMTLPSYKESKVVDLANLYLKYNNDEFLFKHLYKKVKLEKNLNTRLCFSHILYLVKHRAYEKGFNEYLAFRLKQNTSYMIDIEIETLTILFEVLTNGQRMDELKSLATYIDNKYLDEVINSIDGVIITNLEEK